MSVTDNLLANNARYAESFSPSPSAQHIAVVACMDARLNIYGMLGLNDGEAHVIRNAGGAITEDAIRSLAISQRLLGTTDPAVDVRQSIARLRSNPFLPHADEVRGFVLDETTGRLTEVI